MQRTRLKICGLTRSEDVAAAVAAGADALGFVFYEASPRAVNVEQAADLLKSLPPFVTAVGLFVDASVDYVEAVTSKLPLGPTSTSSRSGSRVMTVLARETAG